MVRVILFCWLVLGCGTVWSQPIGYIEGTVKGGRRRDPARSECGRSRVRIVEERTRGR